MPLMTRLLKIIASIFSFFLLLTFASPILADSTCPATVPRPDSPEIDQIIAEAQSRGGAAANVPAKLLEAIYSLEAGPYYANPNNYNCPIITHIYHGTPINYLGPMAVGDLTLPDVVVSNERFSDINQETGMCAPNYCNKLSRCNPSDAMEIGARILLLKLGLWDKANSKPLGSITTKEQIYNATCEYYGSYNPDDLTNELAKIATPAQDGKLSYCEYILWYINQTPYYWPRGPRLLPPPAAAKPFTFKPYCNAVNPTAVTTLLRPNPNDLVPYEKQKLITDPTLTPYCIQRPTVVQNVTYNKALPQPPFTFFGALLTNFSSFTTPFLNSDSQTSTLTETQKNYQYLNQYLGDHPASTMESLGMFEKLAPQTYQNQLRIAMINRALGTFTAANNPYGFEPATPTVHDYPVACWDGSKVVDFTDPSKGTCGSNQLLKLSSFKDNLIPLPEDYLDKETYQTAIEAWQIKDNSKWFQAWQFIPKFTLEDAKGFIKVIPEPLQLAIPNPIEVSHPFLAKTYELSSALFNLLTPYEPTPMENYNTEQWYGPPWETDPWWFKSDENQSQWTPNVGPVCDQTTPVIYGTGALAFGGPIINTVNKTFLLSITPDPSCIIYHTDPITGIVTEDYSNCMVTQEARYSPVYDESYTPFLKEINSNLYAPNGIFNLMEPYNPEKKDYYPAAASDKTANFSYIPGKAEAGLKQPGETAQFLYRYLGSIHCAKQKLISAIQPFFGNEIPLSPECDPNASRPNPSPNPSPGPINPPIGQWLKFPFATQTPFISYCYGPRCETTNSGSKFLGYHAGLDMGNGDNSAIYPAAPGIVHNVGHDINFGHFVIINHNNGWYTIYGHMTFDLLVNSGQEVFITTQLGYQDNSGNSTGSHLHFGLSKNGNIDGFWTSSGATSDPCAAIANCYCDPALNEVDKCP